MKTIKSFAAHVVLWAHWLPLAVVIGAFVEAFTATWWMLLIAMTFAQIMDLFWRHRIVELVKARVGNVLAATERANRMLYHRLFTIILESSDDDAKRKLVELSGEVEKAAAELPKVEAEKSGPAADGSG